MKHHRRYSSKKKTFSKQFLGKHTFHIRQPKDTNLFGQKVRYLIYGIILFSFGIVFFNIQPDSNTNIQVFTPKEKPLQTTYVFYAQNGENYDIFGQQDLHGAPQSWEYLFEGVDLSGNESSILEENAEAFQRIDSETSGEGEQPIQQPDTTKTAQEETGASLGTLIVSGTTTESLGTGKKLSFSEKPSFLGNTLGTETLPSKGIQLLPDYKKCSTPWGYEVNHGESVLAYEQDLNTPDTCKIQRRFCFDGKFSGTFSQQSCSVNTKYSYFQEQFVSYNIPNQNSELIQPSPPPTFTAENVGNGATQEGIDEILKTPNLGGTNRGNEGTIITPHVPEVQQTERSYPNCKTPRGETVKHGQFVKAYKHKNGFNDAPCEVQLRTCVVGTLEGTYEQLSCRHRDTSYIDWLNNYPSFDAGYSDEKMEWIRQLRKNEEYYKPEYGNTLDSLTLEKILRILDS